MAPSLGLNVPLSLPASVLGLAAFCYAWFVARWHARTRGHPLPPGPPRLPHIGARFDQNSGPIWQVYRDLCNTYGELHSRPFLCPLKTLCIVGELVYIPIFNTPIMVLGSPKVILDLLDKRSSITSSRRVSPMTNQYVYSPSCLAIPAEVSVYQRWPVVQCVWNGIWRLVEAASTSVLAALHACRDLEPSCHAKRLRTYVHPQAVTRPGRLGKAHTLVSSASVRPRLPALLPRTSSTFAGSIIKVAYGIQVEENNDRYISLMEKITEGLQAFNPGRYMVQFLPILHYVPAWVPGAGFQRDFAGWREASDKAKEELYARAKAGTVS